MDVIVIWLPCYDDGEYPFPIDPRAVVSYYPTGAVHIPVKLWNKYRKLHKAYEKSCMTCSDDRAIALGELKSLANNMRKLCQ